jgi:hypothetical protein
MRRNGLGLACLTRRGGWATLAQGLCATLLLLANSSVLAASISGNVIGPASQPLSQILVSAYGWNGSAWETAQSAVTNASGGYNLDALPAGTYRLYANDSSGSFASEWHADATALATAQDVSLVAVDSTAQIDFQLTAGLSISGRITDAQGVELPDIRVSAHILGGNGNWQVLAAVFSDAGGDYQIGGLVSGTYRIGFQDASQQYLAEYYDDVTEIGSAQDLVLVGSSLTGVDAVLAGSSSASGRVTDANTLGLAAMSVFAYRNNAGDWVPEGFTQTDNTGGFQLAKLAYGDYRFLVRDPDGLYADEWFDDVNVPAAAQVVTINAASGPAEDIDWVLSFRDRDDDEWADHLDNCPGDANPDQLDTDDDGQGNVCDDDDDGDSIPDTFEEASPVLDPLVADDAALDPDGDTLTNLQEFELGTKLDDADTDGDGRNDGVEVANGTDPLVNEVLVITVITNMLMMDDDMPAPGE